ncbi:hypothetical protein H8D36_07325, partial [archaeon]|nr:hypothetical protein [archaeon]
DDNQNPHIFDYNGAKISINTGPYILTPIFMLVEKDNSSECGLRNSIKSLMDLLIKEGKAGLE